MNRVIAAKFSSDDEQGSDCAESFPTNVSNKTTLQDDRPQLAASVVQLPNRVITSIFIPIGIAVVAFAIWHLHGVWGENDGSRWATVYSLGEHHTYQIDDTPWVSTRDKAFLNGHFYSSKPPVLPTIMAGEYVVLKTLSGGVLSFARHENLVMQILLAINNLIPFIAFLLIYARWLERASASIWVQLFAMATAAIGTLLTTFLVVFNNHTVAAFAFFFAIYLSYEVLQEKKRDSWRIALIGFCASFTAVNEFPAMILPIVLFVPLLLADRRRTLIWFLPMALIPYVAHFVMTYEITGGFLPIYANKAAYIYPGSLWMIDSAGRMVSIEPGTIDSIWEPWGVYFFHNLVGHHGFFTLCPMMLIALVGTFDTVIRGKQRGTKILAISAIALMIYLLVVYTFFSGHRNYGGQSTGPRYFFWIIPIWLMFLPAGLHAMARWQWTRGVVSLLLIISVMVTLQGMRNPWALSWMHQILYCNGLISYK